MPVAGVFLVRGDTVGFAQLSPTAAHATITELRCFADSRMCGVVTGDGAEEIFTSEIALGVLARLVHQPVLHVADVGIGPAGDTLILREYSVPITRC